MELTEIYKQFRIGNLSAIVVAGGVGSRVGGSVPKQHLALCGIPVVVRSLLAFEATPCVHEIIAVIREGEEALYAAYKEKYGITKLKKTVVGGKTRTESAFHGMEAVSSNADYIAVHDAARCLVTRDMIEQVAFAAVRYKAATAACPVTDTVVIMEGGMTKTKDQPARSTLAALSTPQIFEANLYRAISYTAKRDGFAGTDDTSLAHHTGFACRVVDVGHTNIKITNPEDFSRGENILKGRQSTC